ncbi:MAG: dipeptidase [Bacteroidales bacterium]|nr:dipeptidase [Bacteroidales bacterium]
MTRYLFLLKRNPRLLKRSPFLPTHARLLQNIRMLLINKHFLLTRACLLQNIRKLLTRTYFLPTHARMLLLLMAIIVPLSSCTPGEEKLKEKADRIHQKALTVDSHVDTPLWLTREGFRFGERNGGDRSRSKVDIPRMREGGLDGVLFAVFIGQEERTEEGNRKALSEANEIMDSIRSTVSRYPDQLDIAVSPGAFRNIEKNDKLAIFLGMENGYPLGREVALVDSFYDAGIRYITLCHSYNNDICDSSTDSAEHDGLSAFGEVVVARMNDVGMMIDVSHASDASFYDAIQLSRAPVIASHSCARALCDNPRNLTDDMLLKLKENGGVIQMCILSAYVKTPDPNPLRDSARKAVYEKHGNYFELDDLGKEAFLNDWYKVDVDFPQQLATVADVVDHIDHIVEVAGIDHVGIGTDFDGGGGVEGCFDVSEMGNITLELVRRGYSKKEIEKIWSGNLMRVMEEVQKTSISS